MSKSTADMTSDFRGVALPEDVGSKHYETLLAIARAERGDYNYRDEAMRSILPSPVELGYSGGPEVRRISTGYGILSL